MRFQLSFPARQSGPHTSLPISRAYTGPIDPAAEEVDTHGFAIRLLNKVETAKVINRSPRWVELRIRDSGFPRHLLKGAPRFRLVEVANWLGDDWSRSWTRTHPQARIVEVDEQGYLKRPVSKLELASYIGLSPKWIALRMQDAELPRHLAHGQVWFQVREVVEWADERWS